MMLYRGRDYMTTLVAFSHSGTADSPVIGFSTAAGEEYLVFLSTQCCGHLTARIIKRLTRLASPAMHAGRIAISFLQKRQHGLQNRRTNAGSSGIIQINMSRCHNIYLQSYKIQYESAGATIGAYISARHILLKNSELPFDSSIPRVSCQYNYTRLRRADTLNSHYIGRN